MIAILPDLPLFVEVARQHSFTRAAAILNMPVSTLSRRITALEKKLKVPLLRRNSRKVELTPSGQDFYERSSFIVGEAKLALEAVTHNTQNPAGVVRISLAGDLFLGFVEEALSDFAKHWPEISLVVTFSNRWVDLLKEPFDLDLRVGELPDSSLIARKLGSGCLSLFATPAFLASNSPINRLEDLKKVPCITLENHGRIWNMTDGKQLRTIEVNARYSFNTLIGLLAFALDGMGVASLSPSMVKHYVSSGRLIKVLPGWTTPPLTLHVVMANSQMPMRVRLLVDHLVGYLGKLPEVNRVLA